MLRGMMMDRPLLVSSVIDYAAEVFPQVQVISNTVEGGVHRYGYADARERIGRLANALIGLGVKPGDRVATLAWNGYRHFELYYAIAGIGAVCHTINPRLFPEQITYIANHAEDVALFFDLTFLPLVEKVRSAVRHLVPKLPVFLLLPRGPHSLRSERRVPLAPQLVLVRVVPNQIGIQLQHLLNDQRRGDAQIERVGKAI